MDPLRPKSGISSRPLDSPAPSASSRPKVQQLKPQALANRPSTPATLDSPAPGESSRPKVQQLKPQALTNRPTTSAILVSARQKGNPILSHIKLVPWEYADIPADYVVGTTTCAMFLSLKYHRLHPEYIYARVKQLAGKYNLRLVLVMVDIPNHEDNLRELSKTSIINNLTLILCWSAPEAAHYLELYKSSENAQPTAIRAKQAQSYKESLVEFVTVPRSINKSDTASLISTFGSLQNAINAQPEQISAVPGWGEKKVQQWCHAVREDFRVESAKRASAPAIKPRARLPAVNVDDKNDQDIDEEDEEEAILPNTNTVWRERRAFAYYFECAASSIGGGLDVDFWRTTVPQVCRYEPAVWDAIITISALFECPQQSSGPMLQRRDNPISLAKNNPDALGWYSRSVSAVRQRIEQGSIDLFVGLISCVLFICIEAIQGNADGALQLYRQGVQLITALRSQIASSATSKASLLEDTIIPVFIRLGTFALAVRGAPVTALLQDTEHFSTERFDSLKSAREAIGLLAVEIPLFEATCTKHLHGAHVYHLPGEFNTILSSLATRLRNWHTAFDKLMTSLRAKDLLSPQEIGISALLLSCHEMLHVMLETCTSSSLMQFDAYLPNFRNIVEQSAIAPKASVRSDGTQPPFTFDINIGLPLWFTSLRCREPRIRRAALALLRQAPSVQGFYQCHIWAAVGQIIMELEESQAMEMNAAHHPPHLGVLESTKEPIPSSELAASSYCARADMEPRIPTALLIPEEVRIGPISAFRPIDGFPPGITEADIAKWNRGPDQFFLGVSRIDRGLTGDASRMVYQYVPLDF
ncbi:hypothetical protein CBS147311_2751 [Penicillium roqueforti]|nr:hypothetical protein CBS147311_2751 [Penicillium roqueforti]